MNKANFPLYTDWLDSLADRVTKRDPSVAWVLSRLEPPDLAYVQNEVARLRALRKVFQPSRLSIFVRWLFEWLLAFVIVALFLVAFTFFCLQP